MSTLLLFHIACGTTGLLTGVVPTVLPKGTKLHTRVGWVYSVSMSLMAVTALMLTNFDLEAFLTPIAVLSLNQVFIGHAVLNSKGSKTWAAFAKTTAVLSIVPLPYLLYLAWPGVLLGELTAIIWLVTIVLLLLLSVQYLRYDFGGPNPKLRLGIHATRMIGSYMAAWIAFLINAMSTDPLVMVPPVLIGSALIIYWSRQTRKGWRMKRSVRDRQVAL